jgi:hypothetical protein
LSFTVVTYEIHFFVNVFLCLFLGRNKSQRTIGSGSVSRNTTTTSSGGEMGIVEKVLVSLSCIKSKQQVIMSQKEQDLMNSEVKKVPLKPQVSTEERHSIELLDFEKFIGAAVLQLRGAGLGFNNTVTPTTKDSSSKAESLDQK